MRWRCLSWHRNKKNQFLKQIHCDEYIERYAESSPSTSDNSYNDKKEELLQAIDRVIPLLPPNQENIMRLYLGYGYSYKEMAKRYTTSNQRIAKEVNKSIERVKKIIHAGKTTVSSQPIAKHASLSSLSSLPSLSSLASLSSLSGQHNKSSTAKAARQTGYEELLDGRPLQIFRYRYEQKMSFGEIAERMDLSIAAVQQQYLHALEIIQSIKEGNKNQQKRKDRKYQKGSKDRTHKFSATSLIGNPRSPIR